MSIDHFIEHQKEITQNFAVFGNHLNVISYQLKLILDNAGFMEGQDEEGPHEELHENFSNDDIDENLDQN